MRAIGTRAALVLATLVLLFMSASLFGLTLKHMLASDRATVVLSLIAGMLFLSLATVAAYIYALTRVKALTKEVRDIAQGRKLSDRVTLSGRDEVFELGHEINEMLKIMEDVQEYLIVARDAAEAAERAKSSALEQLRWQVSGAKGEKSSADKNLGQDSLTSMLPT